MNENTENKTQTTYVMKHPNKGIYVGLYVLIGLLILWAVVIYGEVAGNDGDSAVGSHTQPGSCNVAQVYIEGDMYTFKPNYFYDENGYEVYYQETYSDVISKRLRELEKDASIDAILVHVDSSGGVLVAGQEIAQAISQTTKPVVSYVRAQALSSAYYAISPSDQIIAMPLSDIGGLGVTRSYVSNYRENQKEGRDYVELTSAPYKHIGSSVRSLSASEKNIIQQEIEEAHVIMTNEIASFRSLDPQVLASLANGKGYHGTQSVELGLIDKVGSFADVADVLRKLVGKDNVVCE